MSLATALTALDTQRDNLAANLTTMGVTAANTETLAQLVPKVLNIESGVDTSDATATATDLLYGETAYVNGSKVTGAISSKSAATYTPSTTNQTITSGQYLSGAQTISGDADLTAANIKSGVSIFGVTGTYQGGGGNLKTGTVIGDGTNTITISDVTFQPSGICITADYAEFPGNIDEVGAFNIMSATQFGFGSNISATTSSGYSMTDGFMTELEPGSYFMSATYNNNTVTFGLEGPQMVTGAVAISGMTYHYAIW